MKADKRILSLSVEEIASGYQFTLHNAKKITTWQVKGIGAGFNKVVEILNAKGDLNIEDYVSG